VGMNTAKVNRAFPEICDRVEKEYGKITPLKKRFAYEYLSCAGNQTEAAVNIGAGKDRRNAQVRGSQMANDPKVKALIDELQAEALDITSVTPEIVLKALLREARDADHSRDRREAWHLIGKHLGMFKADQENINSDNRTREQILDDIEGHFGTEARRRAAMELGFELEQTQVG